MKTIQVNQPGQWCAGLGDMVTWSWIANGSSEPLQFDAEGANAELLRLLDQRVVSDHPDAIDPTPCYRLELDERGRRPRCHVWAEALGFTTEPQRPRWIDSGRTVEPKRIILAPQCHYRSRTWPAWYWIDLNWALINDGFEVVFALEYDDPEFSQRGPSMAYYRYDLRALADLYRSAQLVVSNDSFPAHFAGTLGIKTLALCGPTQATCFTHIPEVTAVYTGVAKCAGCHFGHPFRNVCDIGCQALYSLLPCHVLEAIHATLE